MRLPPDVAFDAILAERCGGRADGLDDRFLSERLFVRGDHRSRAPRRRFSDSSELADRRRRNCPAQQDLARSETAGFTLIEALAALAVASAGIAAIGSLSFSGLRSGIGGRASHRNARRRAEDRDGLAGPRRPC